MIVEDEGAHNIGVVHFEYKQLNESSSELMSRGPTSEFSDQFIQWYSCITNRETHSQLQLDL